MIKMEGKKRFTAQHGMEVHLVSSNAQWWANARWSAIAFIYDKMNIEPPVLGLAFRNEEYGKKIVNEWKDNIDTGKASVEILLIKGVVKQHPTWYRVCIAPEIPHSDILESRYLGVMCRKITMTPDDIQNITMFEKVFNHFGRCRVMALHIDDNNKIVGPIDPKEGFETTNVIITDAWKVSMANSTRNALEWDDDPIIPEGVQSEAPLLIKNLREVHEKANQKK